MAEKILMPALSPTMTEGTLAKWLKKEGDKIKSGDIIAEIETDKATMEYEATSEGTLAKIIIAEGTSSVAVNTVIGILLEDGEGKEALDNILATVSSSAETTKVIPTSITTATKEPVIASQPSTTVKETTIITPPTNKEADKNHRVFITPLAKKIAQQNSVDFTSITGSGPNGRIIKLDIENFITNGGLPKTVASSSSISKYMAGSYEDKPNSGIRKIIAKRLLESKTTIPHYYLTMDLDMDNILEARVQLNKNSGDKYKISVNDFIIKATALAMRDIPEANASWLGDFTRFFKTSDVAVAVATENGLFTPIIKNAESKGLIEISTEMKALAKKAKEGKLKPEEYQGGGFSISNLGMFGIKDFSAIINPPHTGILAVGTVIQKPVVKNNQIVIGNVISITLSADHRILDGAVGAKFLNAVKKYIENPVSMVL